MGQKIETPYNITRTGCFESAMPSSSSIGDWLQLRKIAKTQYWCSITAYWLSTGYLASRSRAHSRGKESQLQLGKFIPVKIWILYAAPCIRMRLACNGILAAAYKVLTVHQINWFPSLLLIYIFILHLLTWAFISMHETNGARHTEGYRVTKAKVRISE